MPASCVIIFAAAKATAIRRCLTGRAHVTLEMLRCACGCVRPISDTISMRSLARKAINTMKHQRNVVVIHRRRCHHRDRRYVYRCHHRYSDGELRSMLMFPCHRYRSRHQHGYRYR